MQGKSGVDQKASDAELIALLCRIGQHLQVAKAFRHQRRET
jgi:hypothetical protein